MRKNAVKDAKSLIVTVVLGAEHHERVKKMFGGQKWPTFENFVHFWPNFNRSELPRAALYQSEILPVSIF